MNRIQRTLLAAAAALSLGAAHASDVGLTQGGTFQWGFADADALRTAALAATAGQATNAIPSFENVVASGAAQVFTIQFGLTGAQAGHYDLRFGMDFGGGGAVFVDGVAQDFKSADVWWNGNWGNTSGVFSLSSALGAGNHTISIYGFENCCHGINAGQFNAGQGWVTFGNGDGLVASVPEPGSLALMLAGMGALVTVGRRRRQG